MCRTYFNNPRAQLLKKSLLPSRGEFMPIVIGKALKKVAEIKRERKYKYSTNREPNNQSRT